MRYLRTFSSRAAAKGCMVDPIAGTVKIRVDATTKKAHVSGVKRCASPWACPVCSFKVRRPRADEFTALVEQAQASRGSALLMTVTVPTARGKRSPTCSVVAPAPVDTEAATTVAAPTTTAVVQMSTANTLPATGSDHIGARCRRRADRARDRRPGAFRLQAPGNVHGRVDLIGTSAVEVLRSRV